MLGPWYESRFSEVFSLGQSVWYLKYYFNIWFDSKTTTWFTFLILIDFDGDFSIIVKYILFQYWYVLVIWLFSGVFAMCNFISIYITIVEFSLKRYLFIFVMASSNVFWMSCYAVLNGFIFFSLFITLSESLSLT